MRTLDQIKHDLKQELPVYYHVHEHEACLAPRNVLYLEELHRDTLLCIEQLEAQNRELSMRCDDGRLEITAAIRQHAEQQAEFLKFFKAYIEGSRDASDATVASAPRRPLTLDELSQRLDESDGDRVSGTSVFVEDTYGYTVCAVLDRLSDGIRAVWNCNHMSDFMEANYGKTWRAWLYPPTEEERKYPWHEQ